MIWAQFWKFQDVLKMTATTALREHSVDASGERAELTLFICNRGMCRAITRKLSILSNKLIAYLLIGLKMYFNP